MSLPQDAQPYLWKSLRFLVIEEERKTWRQKFEFIIQFGFLILSCLVVSVSALIFALFETNEPELVHLKLRSLALICGSVQVVVSHIPVVLNQKRWRGLLNSSNVLYNEMKDDPIFAEFLLEADTTCRKHLRISAMGLVGVFGIPIGRSLLMTGLKGRIHYAFECSTFGFPPVIGWFWNIITAIPIALFIWGFYGMLDCIALQITAYTKVLAYLLQKRPTTHQYEYDKKIVNLQREILLLKKTVVDMSAFAGFVEIMFTALRSSFCFYHMMMAVRSHNYEILTMAIGFTATTLAITYVVCTCGQILENQCEAVNEAIYDSNWYMCQPIDRKTLIILGIFNNHAREFHYKHVVTFNYITLASVLQSSFSLITVLSNFI